MTDTPAPYAGESVRIRRATLADRDALIELSRTVFNETGTDKAREIGEAFWDWQFAKQPAGQFLIWLAELNGRIVGQVPTNSVRLKCLDREVLGAITIDAMVHPAHRDKTLFVKLGRRADQEMGEAGISVGVGLPNRNSLPAAVRFMKYKIVCQVPLLMKPIRWDRLIAKAGAPAWIGGFVGVFARGAQRLRHRSAQPHGQVTVRETVEFPAETDLFWEKASPPHPVIAVRDRRYLAWRYCESPTRRYRIFIAKKKGAMAGYAVTRVFQKSGLRMGALMDLMAEPGRPEIPDALITKVIEELKLEDIDALVALMQNHNFYYPALRRQGFWRVPERVNPRTFNLVCRAVDASLDTGQLMDGKNWFLTLGDYDVY